MKRKLSIFVLFLTCFLTSGFLKTAPVYAAEQDLVISEIMYNPEGGDQGHEWIELYNSGADPITIIGGSEEGSLRLVDGGSNRLLAEEAAQGSMTVAAGGRVVLAQDVASFLADYPFYSGSVIEVSGMSLKNTGESLSLRTNVDGEVWGEVTYNPEWGGNEDGKSLEKVDPLGADDASNWQSSNPYAGTPGTGYTENQSPEAVINSNNEVEVDQEIVFEASSSSDLDGEVVNHFWNFGDGETQETTETSVGHTYTAQGEYPVTLFVLDNEGAFGKAQKTIQVNPGDEPIPDSRSVVLSEVLAAPGSSTDWDGSGAANQHDEWIELYNSGTEAVDLSGYQLDDVADGGSNPFVIPEGTTIQPGEYKVFYKKDTGATLNNGSDSVRLLNPAGELVEEFAYTSAHTDLSWAKNDQGDWEESETPTPGAANEFGESDDDEDDDDDGDDDGDDQEEEDQDDETGDDQEDQNESSEENFTKMLIAELRAKALGTRVLITGIITATPEILGSKTIYLQDGSGGIKIRLDGGDYSNLALGDKIKVWGILAEAYGEYYLKIDDGGKLEVVKHAKPVKPEKVPTGKIGEDLEGHLVMIEGRVVRTSGDTFYVDDGSGEIKVYIKDSTGIDKPRMTQGMMVRVMGIVSQYKDYYRILPRYQSDIVILEEEGDVLGAATSLPKTGGSELFGLLSLGLLGSGFILRRKFAR